MASAEVHLPAAHDPCGPRTRRDRNSDTHSISHDRSDDLDNRILGGLHGHKVLVQMASVAIPTPRVTPRGSFLYAKL